MTTATMVKASSSNSAEAAAARRSDGSHTGCMMSSPSSSLDPPSLPSPSPSSSPPAATTTVMMTASEAFPEAVEKVPLHPAMDEQRGYGLYKWGHAPLPEARRGGVQPFREELDNQFHQAVKKPWPSDARVFHPNDHPEHDRINASYGAMISDSLPEGGFGGEGRQQQQNPPLESRWERLLAFHHGLYRPPSVGETRSADDIRLNVNRFNERVHFDEPKGACKYLLMEEHKCLQAHQVEVDMQGAAAKCVKWFNEWQRCKWDEEKLTKGYSFIDMKPPRKRKPYIAAPDHQYA